MAGSIAALINPISHGDNGEFVGSLLFIVSLQVARSPLSPRDSPPCASEEFIFLGLLLCATDRHCSPQVPSCGAGGSVSEGSLPRDGAINPCTLLIRTTYFLRMSESPCFPPWRLCARFVSWCKGTFPISFAAGLLAAFRPSWAALV